MDSETILGSPRGFEPHNQRPGLTEGLKIREFLVVFKIGIHSLLLQEAVCSRLGGTMAHQVGQLGTKLEVRSSNRRPSRDNFSLVLCVHTTLGVPRSGEGKDGEESSGKLSQKALCQE
ncbi:hypothetical protein PoB_005482700 [Plakobranchus ocellatus]|uniref:Uncharacterized protein n=1 Tax=Plakobranchus ocellatus TaxID=259542 RepID=A0AAV4CAL4_9GAST|nr:hypothetical protein PoB_005482700 [Plakobranchus ocellatus]